LGDHLVASGNPLAISMQLRIDGLPWREALAQAATPAPQRHVLVLVHGLAMHDGQWLRQGHHHGQALAKALGCSVLALHYNSGRTVADNGRDFSAQLDRLLAEWPVPVQALTLVAHSMGGLVSRSAVAQGAGRPWRQRLRGLVCLGTPHHGAPLERGGRWIDLALGLSPYGAPFAKLGRSRSAGITDLRFGNVLPSPSARGEQHQDDRPPVPWPRELPLYLVGATTAAQTHGLQHHLLGDGLVPLASALGEHRLPEQRLRVPASHRLVLTKANHWDLLNRPEVTAQLLRWLG
jgi:pimeloyl-ACP methyl ester carboxylesterase